MNTPELPHEYAFSHETPSRKLWDEDDMRDYAAAVSASLTEQNERLVEAASNAREYIRGVYAERDTGEREEKEETLALLDQALTSTTLPQYRNDPELVRLIEEFPDIDKRQFDDPENPNGYMESFRQWSERNYREVEWIMENAPRIKSAALKLVEGREE